MGTDPDNPDTDGGGVSDGAEASNNDDWRQSDPLNPFDDKCNEPSNDSIENANDQSSAEESGLTKEELAEELQVLQTRVAQSQPGLVLQLL